MVNEIDPAIFQGANFDLDNDNQVDVRGIEHIIVERSEDLGVLIFCYFNTILNNCTESECHTDPVLDRNDIIELVNATQFDLNGDGILDQIHETTVDLTVLE